MSRIPTFTASPSGARAILPHDIGRSSSAELRGLVALAGRMISRSGPAREWRHERREIRARYLWAASRRFRLALGPPRTNHSARLDPRVTTHTRRLGGKLMPRLEARVAEPSHPPGPSNAKVSRRSAGASRTR